MQILHVVYLHIVLVAHYCTYLTSSMCLQEQLLVQEKESTELRAQMRDALAAAAEVEATAAAEASGARAKWAGEVAQLTEDCDSQRRQFEEAAAMHRKELEVFHLFRIWFSILPYIRNRNQCMCILTRVCTRILYFIKSNNHALYRHGLCISTVVKRYSVLQDLSARYEDQLSAAKAAAANAAELSETEKAAAMAAHTAATAASEREAVLKQNLHDAEERSASTSSQLGATQQRVSFFAISQSCLCILCIAFLTCRKRVAHTRIVVICNVSGMLLGLEDVSTPETRLWLSVFQVLNSSFFSYVDS